MVDLLKNTALNYELKVFSMLNQRLQALAERSRMMSVLLKS